MPRAIERRCVDPHRDQRRRQLPRIRHLRGLPSIRPAPPPHPTARASSTKRLGLAPQAQTPAGRTGTPSVPSDIFVLANSGRVLVHARQVFAQLRGRPFAPQNPGLLSSCIRPAASVPQRGQFLLLKGRARESSPAASPCCPESPGAPSRTAVHQRPELFFAQLDQLRRVDPRNGAGHRLKAGSKAAALRRRFRAGLVDVARSVPADPSILYEQPQGAESTIQNPLFDGLALEERLTICSVRPAPRCDDAAADQRVYCRIPLPSTEAEVPGKRLQQR